MIRIIEKGQPKAQIVVAETPMKVEEHAAAELQSYLFQMSGVRVPIVCEPSKELSNLFVGSACPTQGLDLSSNTFGFDGYIVKTVGKDVLLVGVKPYSCLYAVYHLLEEYLDFGFFEDGDQIPNRDTVVVPEIDAIRKPRFELRGENLNMQPVYSGMRWWDWPEFKQWLDYLIKKHMNLMDADGCGIPSLAAAKFGIQIELNDYQKKRMDLLKRLYEYARMCGFRVMNSAGLYRQTSHGDVGFSAEAEGPQFTEFIAKLEAQNGEKLPGTPLEWCGYHSIVLDPSHPTVKRVITAGIEASIETYGTDHVYGMWLPSEEGIGGGDKEAGDKATYDSIIEVMKLIKDADPEAIIYTPPPCAGNPTFEAQNRAIRDSGLPIFGDVWLNNPGRMQDFLICDYYWGIPWTTGMLGQCGRATNPNGDLRYAIKNVQTLASDPRADKLFGFRVSNEINHRNIMTLDAFHTLAWNPGELDADEYIRKYNVRRYGPDAAERLWPATEIITQTLLAYQDQGVMNGVLYRHWDGTNLPGTTSVSVKRAISFLPKLRTVMELLLAEHDTLKESPLYQFDVIDYGRTYLSAQFNDKLARTRKAFRSGKKAEFEAHAAEVIEVMRFIAKYCSAHEQFRLKIMDDWASKYGEITPGYSNALVNWITFTCLLSLENWEMLLDYCADDFAELVEGYYLPRVKLYLQKMRELLEAGLDISGRQVERGSNSEMKARISDWATPQDNLVWSPYGDTCEPELTADDEKLAHELILAGSLSGKYDFYNGPLDTLVRELLDRFPVPDDIADIMAEPDQAQSIERKIPVGIPGDVHNGFLTPSVVEQVRIPNELGYLVDKQPVSREYNLARGETTCYNIRLHHSLIITRLQDEPASIGDYPIAVFEFEALGGKYELRYDPGSDVTLAKFFVDKVG